MLILVVIVLLLTYFAGSVSFNTNPSISPLTDKRPDTTDDLVCTWNASTDTTQQNVSWYKNGESFSNETNVDISQSTLDSDNTTREEVWNCTVSITNGTDTITQTVNITIRNAIPTTPVMTNSTGQNIGNNTNVTEDVSNVFNLTATDPDLDTITYGNLGSLPSGSSLSSTTGVFTWTPTYQSTDINITFIATDNYGDNPGITSKKVFFIVQFVNDAPQFSPALSNQAINESQVLNYAISGSDEESNHPLNFSLNVTPTLDLVVNNTGNTSAVIMFAGNRTATYSEAGNYTVNVTIYDNLNASSSNTFTLTISQVNVAPELETIPTQNSSQGQSFSFYVYADDNDVNNTLNFTIIPTACSISNPWSISTVNNSHNATGLVNITNLTNNHVICRYVRITVIDDNGAEDYQDVFLNISNTNDPPNIEVLSSYSNNTGGNNITDLTAYADSPFVYIVNATDVDTDTYESEVLTYSDNATFFDIIPGTGVISFTPNQSLVGNHTLLINVSDDGGLSDTQIMNLEIINNSAPVLMSIGSLSCAEDSLCFIVITATDADNDNLNFTSNNTAVFSLTNNASQSPVTSAYVNYTPTQSNVGAYTVVVTVADIRGATDTEAIAFTINNTNDAPEIQSFSFPSTIVEAHGISFYFQADDDDYDLESVYEYVSFNDTNITGKDLFDISTILNSTSNKTYAQIIFTPSIGDAGNYSVNITATDYYGAVDWVVKNFTVQAKTNPPNISRIMPYGMPYSTTTIFNFTESSNYATPLTSVNFSENRSVIYNITVTDDTTSWASLTFAWYIDGVLNSTSPYLNLSYNFFSSGVNNITVFVSDDTYENSSWTWNVTVENINRAPKFINNLNNISMNSTTVYIDYLKKTSSVHFIDPDDDLNSNNDFDAGENSSLTYNVTSCSVATITITDDSIRVVPEEIGSCTVYFTAYDAGSLSNTSNAVMVNVSDVPNATEIVETTTPSSSGGGGGRSRSIMIPITKQEELPKAIEILVPELVTIYKNQTVLVPVTLQNNWNSSLMGIKVNASTNASFVKLEFSQNYFESLGVGEKKNTTLIVSNYRLGENYEIKLTANVTTPKASDSALVILNSIEQAESGAEVEVKVTFAQDLLSDNPECAELNELLYEAKNQLAVGSTSEASKMVDGVINGCKYLVSVSKKAEQKPQNIITRLINEENFKYLLILGGILLIGVISVLLLRKKKAEAVQEKEKETEKEEIKPYWP